MRSTLVSMHGIVRLASLENKGEGTMDYWPILEKGIMQIDLQLRNIIEHYESDQHIGISNQIDFTKVVEVQLPHQTNNIIEIRNRIS